MGIPFLRMERLQKYMGIPLPDATQWDLVKDLANTIYSIYLYLETLAAQGRLMQNDDTKARVISMILENKKNLTENVIQIKNNLTRRARIA